MGNLKNKVKAYLRLIRIHTLIATALTPIFGACATFPVLEGDLISWDKLQILIPLFLIGMIVHVFGEILNDYMDYDIDKASSELSDKPLVRGDISKRGALFGLVTSLIFLIIIIVLYRFNALSLILLTISAVTGIIYQLISKKWIHSAYFLAFYVFFIILFGGVYAGNYNNLFDVPLLVYIICILGYFHSWINTAILGHLKDIKNDTEFGAVTLPMRFGVKVEGSGKSPKLIISMGFRFFVIVIQIINLIVAFIPIILYERFYDGNINLILLSIGLILLSVAIMASQFKVLWYKLFERNKLMKTMAIREIATFYLAIVLLFPLVGWVVSLIFIFLPLIWFFITNLVYTKDPMKAAI
jgi:protoheme IX farnesyltransferase